MISFNYFIEHLVFKLNNLNQYETKMWTHALFYFTCFIQEKDKLIGYSIRYKSIDR